MPSLSPNFEWIFNIQSLVNWINVFLLLLIFEGTSIQMTASNLYRVSVAFFPPTAEVLSNMCRQGFDDTLRYLKKNSEFMTFVSFAISFLHVTDFLMHFSFHVLTSNFRKQILSNVFYTLLLSDCWWKAVLLITFLRISMCWQLYLRVESFWNHTNWNQKLSIVVCVCSDAKDNIVFRNIAQESNKL